jgi:dipeptidyl aminopeptidase/acylaminoacyl peptidase
LRRTLASITVAVLIALAPVLAEAASRRRIEISDLHRIVRVSDPQISPDGKSVVCVIARANVKDDEWESELILVSTQLASSESRPLTHGRKHVREPRWSPSGDRIAFIAEAGSGKDAKPQVFVLPMNGGDARKVTDAPEGVAQFAWRPDGRDLAFVSADEPANKKAIEAHEDAFEVGLNDYLAKAAAPVYHIWLAPAAGGAATRLTSGSWSLPVSEMSAALSWSPDGKTLLFTRVPESSFGAFDQSRVQVLDVESGEIAPLTSDDQFSTRATRSPDGSRVAFWRPRDGDFNNENEILVMSAAGGAATDVTRAIDRDILHAFWMPDGKSLLVGGMDRTRVSLWIQPLDGPARRLDLGEAVPSWSFSVDANVGRTGAIVFTASEPKHPTELYYLASSTAKPRRLTDFNAEVAALDLGSREAMEWQGPDGFHEDGVVTFPPDFDPSKKYPLVLLIHGGPQSASTTGFAALAQLMAARGWVVFSPNYRGSDNLGNAYQRAIFNDAGAGPGRDVMSGLEEITKRGFVDRSRVGVSGWSYGGYMTSWLTGHYDGWKAAVSGAAVNDLVEEYALSDFNVSNRYSFAGFSSPYSGEAIGSYREQSPITYVAKIKTPTVILCDTGDARVPITQSYQMFRALKDHGVTTKFYAYPVAGHFPADPVRAADVQKRWIDWLAEYLK